MLSSYVTTGDLSGRRFGTLTVLSFAGTTPHAEWFCICDCGERRKVRATKLLGSLVSSCATCARRTAAAIAGKSRELPLNTAISRSIWSDYRANAKRKRLDFQLSVLDVEALSQGNCHYCGDSPATEKLTKNKTRTSARNGIDRRDNSIGYSRENTVSCCSTCNYAKREMSSEQFVAWAKRVASHSK